MRQDRRHVGSSAYLSGVRRHTLLRQLAEPSCEKLGIREALAIDADFTHRFMRAQDRERR